MTPYMPCPICSGRLRAGQTHMIVVDGVPCLKRYRRCVPCGVSIRTLEVPLKGRGLDKVMQRAQAASIVAELATAVELGKGR